MRLTFDIQEAVSRKQVPRNIKRLTVDDISSAYKYYIENTFVFWVYNFVDSFQSSYNNSAKLEKKKLQI